MADIRTCEQCGTEFEPRREHARFCSARCRVAWNREHASDRAAQVRALDWSLTAMCDAAGRLRLVRAEDPPRALAAISEAVWWVTIVDATLVRYHSSTYDDVLAGHPKAERRTIEGTLGGLRYVRNRMGQYLNPADFICSVAGEHDPAADCIASWTWASLPEPGLASLPPRGQEWELTRYRAYQTQLANRPVGEIFTRATTFLRLVASRAGSATSAEDSADDSAVGSAASTATLRR